MPDGPSGERGRITDKGFHPAGPTSEETTDPFGRAVADHSHDRTTEPLVVRDGERTRDHPIEAFYFEPFDPESEAGRWLASWVRGPLLDAGAGAGRHALVFQERMETVAVDRSDRLVELMTERGVRDARVGDMFSLRECFPRDRFGSALAVGTQAGLAGSMRGLRRWLGYRADPTPGLASRVFHFAYDGDVSETLLFRLFSPARLREATVGTGWEVADVRRGEESYYRAALRKQ